MDATTLDQLRIGLDPLSQAGLALALFIIMFSVALGLKTDDFSAAMKNPAAYFGGVFGQIVGLPLLTMGLLLILSPPPSIALGMIVVASCPGGNVSNMMAYFGRGDVALSVALTATSSLIAAFLMPVMILFWSGLYPPTANLLDHIQFDPAAFIIQTTALLAIPLIVGMSLARWAAPLAARLQKPGATTGTILLAVIVVYGTLDLLPQLFGALPIIMPPVILHSACAFLLGATIARLLRRDVPVRRSLTLEIGLQNSGLAMVILIGQFDGLGGAAAVAAAWGVWHLIVGGAIIGIYRNMDQKNQSTP